MNTKKYKLLVAFSNDLKVVFQCYCQLISLSDYTVFTVPAIHSHIFDTTTKWQINDCILELQASSTTHINHTANRVQQKKFLSLLIHNFTSLLEKVMRYCNRITCNMLLPNTGTYYNFRGKFHITRQSTCRTTNLWYFTIHHRIIRTWPIWFTSTVCCTFPSHFPQRWRRMNATVRTGCYISQFRGTCRLCRWREMSRLAVTHAVLMSSASPVWR